METGANASVLGRMLGPYGVLRGNRNLQLLFGGQVVSTFGDWLYVLALGILAYEITGPATVVAVLTFARLLPYALLLPFSGDTRRPGEPEGVDDLGALGRGACMFGLLFAVTEGTLWIAYPLVFLATAFSSLFKPAMNSVLPALVGDEDRLGEANGIWAQMDSVSFVLGPALGGVLALLGTPELAFVINGVTFLVSAATLLFIHIHLEGDHLVVPSQDRLARRQPLPTQTLAHPILHAGDGEGEHLAQGAERLGKSVDRESSAGERREDDE